MALQTLFLEIYLALLAINGGIYIVDATVDIPLVSPFNASQNVTASTQPSLFNGTDNSNTLSSNFTTTDVLSNSTIGGDSSLINPLDSLFYPITLLYTFVQFMTGAFVFQTLLIFGFPDVFVFVLQGMIGLLLVITVVYYLTGR